jgi:hypothetical protein
MLHYQTLSSIRCWGDQALRHPGVGTLRRVFWRVFPWTLGRSGGRRSLCAGTTGADEQSWGDSSAVEAAVSSAEAVAVSSVEAAAASFEGGGGGGGGVKPDTRRNSLTSVCPTPMFSTNPLPINCIKSRLLIAQSLARRSNPLRLIRRASSNSNGSF